jgi:zinc protease
MKSSQFIRPTIACLCLAALGWAQPAEVRTETLQNGMKILIQEDHNIPNVALYLFFRVGSRNEHPGATGLSHFFEHMMFKGAKKYGPNEFEAQMEKNGGNNDAYTNKDTTVYTDSFPRSALELVMDMESDRIRDLSFDPKSIESERGVVYSEWQLSVGSRNSGVLGEQLTAAAFMAHPYHWPIIGWPSDIESWTMDDLKAHYQMGYAPNNCVVVVVGDVSNGEVMALAKKYLEPIPRREPPPPVRTKEPEQLGERRVVVRKPAQLPMEAVAFHIPESKNADDAPLDILQAVLWGGQSSRLYRRLVDKEQLVLDIWVRTEETLDPGLIVFSFSPRSGVETDRAEKALFEELDRLRNEPVSGGELRKAKNQFLAGHYRQLKTIVDKADMLGIYEVYYGDYRKMFTAEETLEAVTAADVQRVARQYLTEKNRTVAILIPEAPAAPIDRPAGESHP